MKKFRLRRSRKDGNANPNSAGPASLDVPATLPFNPTPALVAMTKIGSNGTVEGSVQRTVQLVDSANEVMSLWAYILGVYMDAGAAVHLAVLSGRDPSNASACSTQRFLELRTPASLSASDCEPKARMRFVHQSDAGKTTFRHIYVRKIRWQSVTFGSALSAPVPAARVTRGTTEPTAKTAVPAIAARAALPVPAPHRAVGQNCTPNPLYVASKSIVATVDGPSYTLAMGTELAGPPRVLGVPFSAYIHKRLKECTPYAQPTGAILGILSHYRLERTIVHIVLRSQSPKSEFWQFDTGPTQVTAIVSRDGLDHRQRVHVLDRWGKLHVIQVVIANLSIRRIQAGK